LKLQQLDAAARDLAERSINWMDCGWDAAAGCFRAPDKSGKSVCQIRESTWYALGLFLRNGSGDRARAIRALDTILNHQLVSPNQPYHGTWRRFPQEEIPSENAIEWRDYDPNWREFIGTTLALIVIEFESCLNADLIRRIDEALHRAIVGALNRNVPAHYTNISLMTAFLLDFGARRLGESAWSAASARLATDILNRFRTHNTFDEYNSPTYYGVDLYALALWRSYASQAFLREAGAEMEAALWRDIAQYYHAGMRNMAGPYDRSYGMDMQRYISCLGMWIWMETGYEQAPFPNLNQPFEHANDFAFAPPMALLGVRIPDVVRSHFRAFRGERQVEQIIWDSPRRVATACVGERVMLGAETGNRDYLAAQFHPAVIHWLIDDHKVGWIRLRLQRGMVADARAERNRLSITCSGSQEYVFQIAAPNIGAEAVQRNLLQLPGLKVRVNTKANGPTVTHAAELVELRYGVSDSSAEFILTIEE
jgi:hypothetical protein